MTYDPEGPTETKSLLNSLFYPILTTNTSKFIIINNLLLILSISQPIVENQLENIYVSFS